MALISTQPYQIFKRTGTVVKYLRDTNNPSITKKIVNVGPNSKLSKISRSELTFENGKPKELRLTSLSLGEAFEFVYKKTQNGWKRIFG